MKRIALAGAALALVAGTALAAAPDVPAMPQPAKEHEWLMQFVGEWEADVEVSMDPAKPPEKAKGMESVRQLGGFWIVADYRGTFMDKPFNGIFTIGYAPEKRRYVGTWIDSLGSHLWTYEGTLDAAGKILTLESEGPCPATPGKLVRFKEQIELKTKDQRVFTSSMLGEDGKWVVGMTINYRRK